MDVWGSPGDLVESIGAGVREVWDWVCGLAFWVRGILDGWTYKGVDEGVT